MIKFDADPSRDLLLIDGDHRRMQARVERLNNRRAHREYPHSRTNHRVFNVRFDPTGAGAEEIAREISVLASLRAVAVSGERTSTCNKGTVPVLRLRPAGDSFRIAHKRVNSISPTFAEVGDVAIIL